MVVVEVQGRGYASSLVFKLPILINLYNEYNHARMVLLRFLLYRYRYHGCFLSVGNLWHPPSPTLQSTSTVERNASISPITRTDTLDRSYLVLGPTKCTSSTRSTRSTKLYAGPATCECALSIPVSIPCISMPVS